MRMKFQINKDTNQAELKHLYLPDPFFILLVLVGFGVPIMAMFMPDFAQENQLIHYILWPPIIGTFGVFLWISKSYISMRLTDEKIEINRGFKSWNLPITAVTGAFVERGEIHQKRSGTFPFFRLVLNVSLPDDPKRKIDDGYCIALERDYESHDKRDKHADEFEPVVAYIKSMIKD
jgi:hypothetical protein